MRTSDIKTKTFTRQELNTIAENARYEAAQLAIHGRAKAALNAVASVEKIESFINSKANLKFNKFAIVNGSFTGIA